MYKLSVIVPVYNLERYLSKFFNFLKDKSLNDIEIIFVDDGSTDDSLILIKEFIENDIGNIKVIEKQNGGVSSARNKGIENSKGKFLLFLDGDDILNNNFFEIFLKEYDETLDFYFYKYDIIDEEGKVLSKYEKKFEIPKGQIKNRLLLENILERRYHICTGSFIVKKEILINYDLKYSEMYINGEDQNFLYRLLTKVKKILFIDETLAYYVQRKSSISNTFNANKLDAVFAFESFFEEVKSNKELNYLVDLFKSNYIMHYYIGVVNDFIRQNNYNLNFDLLLKNMKYLTATKIVKKEMTIKKIFSSKYGILIVLYFVLNKRYQNVLKILDRFY